MYFAYSTGSGFISCWGGDQSTESLIDKQVIGCVIVLIGTLCL